MMKNKSIYVGRVMYALAFTIFMIYLCMKSNQKILFIPFIICGLAIAIKNIFLIQGKKKYVELFDRIFVLGFLLFFFGFLCFWCYINFINKEYIALLFSIPFWIVGIMATKKRFIKSNQQKSKINYPIVISVSLVAVALIIGISMLVIGIKDTYELSQKTRNYETTEGYFIDYDIYSSSKKGITYRLTYRYIVDNQEYTLSTDYGTSYIPDVNSTRNVQYNPESPSEAVLEGANRHNSLIYGGAFFTFVSLTFVIGALTVLGKFDRFKINVFDMYVGVLFFVLGIGMIMLQNGTTQSLMETIKSFGLWICIPIMFIIVGIYQIIKCMNKK